MYSRVQQRNVRMTNYMQIKLNIQNNLNKYGSNLKQLRNFQNLNNFHHPVHAMAQWLNQLSLIAMEILHKCSTGPSLCCPLLHKGFVFAQMF